MVEHLDAWHEAKDDEPPPPPPPPAGQFGTLLPPRLPESTGPVVTVGSDAQLRSAISVAQPGTRIEIPIEISGSGDIYFGCAGTPAAPITFFGNGGLTGYSSVYLTGQHIRMRGLDIHNVRATRPTTSGRFVELDRCHIHDCVSQGILTSSGVQDWQIWNCVIERNGVEANYDHGIYAATSAGRCVIANCLIRDNWAYNLQVYPNCHGLIVTGCTIDGGQIQPDNRGGIVFGSDSAPGNSDCLFVGIVSTRAPYNGVIRINQPLGLGNRMVGAVGWGNSESDYESDPGIVYEACLSVTSSPYVNADAGDYRPRPGSPLIGLVPAAYHGYLPALDITGKPRVTADAGAYAA